jgi:hypothetical protein
MRTRARLGRLPLVSGLIAMSIVTMGVVGPVAASRQQQLRRAPLWTVRWWELGSG